MRYRIILLINLGTVLIIAVYRAFELLLLDELVNTRCSVSSNSVGF